MKRKEMIKLIENEILVEISSPEDFHPILLAEIILNTVEKHGMLPPPRVRTEDEQQNPKYDMINMWKYIREWENDDQN